MTNDPEPEQPVVPADKRANGAQPSEDAHSRVGGEPRVVRANRPERPAAQQARAAGIEAPLTTAGTRVTVGELERGEMLAGTHPGDRFVRHRRAYQAGFRRTRSGHLEALPEATDPTTPIGRIFHGLKRIVIGSPLSTAAAAHERLTKVKALAVLSSDALSSVTYATEAILASLLVAGYQAFSFNVGIAIAITVLIAIVVFSYRQTIYAYPKGGGSYIVSKDNLGTLPGLVAGGSLLTGYILTVSVSIAAGIANLISLAATSAGVDLRDYRVEAALVAILILVLLNLRGIRESGTIFSAPTYIFLVLMFGMLGFGLYQYFTGTLGTVTHVVGEINPPAALAPVGLFLLLRAFASGCAALTGIEAISDGVPAFQRPESKNAATTITILGVLLSVMFLGISFLADQMKVRISDTETVVSQLGRTIFGTAGAGYVIYTLFLVFTALLLVLAANTAFADFPRLSFFLARDGFLPHQFAFRGDRLAFSVGIVTLGILAGLLIALFGGATAALLPLYAVGVFISFTLSQSGMVMRWWRKRPPGWQPSMVVNIIGACTTGGVALILAISNFTAGAWLVLIIVPLLVLLFLRINKHYREVSSQVGLEQMNPALRRAAAAGLMVPIDVGNPKEQALVPANLHPLEHLVVIPVSGLNQVTLRSVAYARSAITQHIVAVHVASDEESEQVDAFEKQWHEWVPDVPLVVVESPYRSLTRPLLTYIDALQRQQPDRVLTIVLPEFVPAHWWEHLLHNQTALRLKGALLGRPGIVVISVPYHVMRQQGPAAATIAGVLVLCYISMQLLSTWGLS